MYKNGEFGHTLPRQRVKIKRFLGFSVVKVNKSLDPFEGARIIAGLYT